MNIPIDFTNAAISKPSSQDSPYNQNRPYTSQTNPNESKSYYSGSNSPPRPVSSYAKRSTPDLPTTNRPSTAHSTDRSVNEMRVNLSSPSPYQQQKKVSLQIDENHAQQQRVTK